MSSTSVEHTTMNRSQCELTSGEMCCRVCSTALRHVVVDLGLSPLCENVISLEKADEPETFYPLKMYVCDHCWLVQLHDHVGGQEIFDGSYAYASSVSKTWLKQCKDYCHQMAQRLELDSDSLVVEIASNDGYLLKNFVEMEVPCLGVEPAIRLAEIAESQGIPILKEYFGSSCAERLRTQGCQADLMIGNNVLAHVPDLHDFLAGYRLLLAPEGTATFEFPHLLNLIQGNQYDTIYQEHYCYFSLIAVRRALADNGLRLYDVEELSTHGGSLRIFVCHEESAIETSASVAKLIEREVDAGLDQLDSYRSFAKNVIESKYQLLDFLIACKRSGKAVVGYGAPGKGNTLLNYCGIREDLLEFTVDRNPLKQNSLLPGSRIPVYEPEAIDQRRPDYILILPWNLKDEIIQQLAHVREWGAKFVVPIPTLMVVD